MPSGPSYGKDAIEELLPVREIRGREVHGPLVVFPEWGASSVVAFGLHSQSPTIQHFLPEGKVRSGAKGDEERHIVRCLVGKDGTERDRVDDARESADSVRHRGWEDQFNDRVVWSTRCDPEGSQDIAGIDADGEELPLRNRDHKPGSSSPRPVTSTNLRAKSR